MKVTAKVPLVFGVVMYKPGETFVIPERRLVEGKLVDVPRWEKGPSVKGAPNSKPVPDSLVGKPKAFNPLTMTEDATAEVTKKGKNPAKPLVTGHEDPGGAPAGTSAAVAEKAKADAEARAKADAEARAKADAEAKAKANKPS